MAGQGWVRMAGDCGGWPGMGKNSGGLPGTARAMSRNFNLAGTKGPSAGL